MTASDIVVRPADDGDEIATLRVLQAAFPQWPRIELATDALDHLRWKMRLSETDERLGRVAELDGEIVGLMLARSVRAKIRERVTRCVVASDAAVLPDHREAGVMRELRRYRAANARGYALSFSGQTEHPAIIKTRAVDSDQREAMGNELVRYDRPLTWRATLSTVKLRPGRPARKLLRSGRMLLTWLAGRARDTARRPNGRPWTVSLQTSLDERVDGLFGAAAQQFDFIVVRDLEYVNWRFTDRRAGKFAIYVAEQASHLLGYVVLTVDRRRRKGYIADILAVPGQRDVVRSLIDEGLAHLRRQEVERVECWLPRRHVYGDTMRLAGFIQKDIKWRLGYRIMSAPEEALAFLREPEAAIHFTLSDTDIV
jgi:predicted N-acetyltransferase YhbS